MRLIDTRTILQKDFLGDVPPSEPFAILSHRWGPADQEVSLQDFRKGRKTATAGYRKIRDFCRVARTQSAVRWAWVDTCCIDKKSSAELSEAINSMFRWYAAAQACYVFLDDVDARATMATTTTTTTTPASTTTTTTPTPTSSSTRKPWQKSHWWTRGWTLQELIAPRAVHFYDAGWHRLGTRTELAREITQLTGIPLAALLEVRAFLNFSAAQRMSWAAGRKTSRVEDAAYSLLGLFQIHMPLLYGEGTRAFRRLQLEILARWPGEAILAWQPAAAAAAGEHHDEDDDDDPDHDRFSAADVFRPRGVLADSPDDFGACADIARLPALRYISSSSGNGSSDGGGRRQVRYPTRRRPPQITSWGIELHAGARAVRPRDAVAARFPFWRRDDPEGFWAVTLTTLSPGSGAVVEFPCTLILARTNRSRAIYRRVECLHWDPRKGPGAREEALRERYVLEGDQEEGEEWEGGVEGEERVFYLWFEDG